LLYTSTRSMTGIKSLAIAPNIGGKWRQIFVVGSLFQAFVLLLYVIIDRFFISSSENSTIPGSKEGAALVITTTVRKTSHINTSTNNAIRTPSTYSGVLLHRLALLYQLSVALTRHLIRRIYSIPSSLLGFTQSFSRFSGYILSQTRFQSRSLLLKRNIPVSTNLPYRSMNDKYFSIVAEEDESVAQVLSRVTSYPSFWFMLLAKSSLLMVGQFISFIPSYLGTEPSLLCSLAESSQIASFFAVSYYIS